jgi:4-amino-4-deoxy-L-arabinose transferase-like glycosyltransferase
LLEPSQPARSVAEAESSFAAKPAHKRLQLPAIVCIVFTAFLLRLAAWAMIPHHDVWHSAAETANVAKSVAAGRGFSSPFGQPTGATAWIAPAYALMLAGMFKLFGVFSGASALAAFLVQIAISAMTCIPIIRLGKELGSTRAGLWAGWLWAGYPYFVLLPVLFLWETALSAFLLSWVLLLTARLRREDGISLWASYGALWGVTALTNPALLALMPVCAAWLGWQRHFRKKPLLAKAAVASCLFLLLIAPWCWRNWRAFHSFIPLRSSFGEALWLGNHPGGRGRHAYGDNAYENSHELERFQALGEVAYAKARERAAVAYIKSAPGRFLRNVAYRVSYWWLAVGEHAPIFLLYAALGVTSLAGAVAIFSSGAGAWYLVAVSLLVFPITYYVTDTMARYRHPVEPAMVLASAYLFDWMAKKVSARPAGP